MTGEAGEAAPPPLSPAALASPRGLSLIPLGDPSAAACDGDVCAIPDTAVSASGSALQLN